VHPTRIPIIALTAHASQAQREECRTEGTDAVITKPVNPPALRKALSPIVESPFSSV
jgi:CheY-like chemotaxis protein